MTLMMPILDMATKVFEISTRMIFILPKMLWWFFIPNMVWHEMNYFLNMYVRLGRVFCWIIKLLK